MNKWREAWQYREGKAGDKTRGCFGSDAQWLQRKAMKYLLQYKLPAGSWALTPVHSFPFEPWNLAWLLMLPEWAHLFSISKLMIPKFTSSFLISWLPGHTNYVLSRCNCLGRISQALPTQHVQNYLHLYPSFPKINLPFIHAPHSHHWQDSPRYLILKPRVLI